MNTPTKSRNPDPKPHRDAAFTLTDLLAVIAVVGLLTLVALPTLGNARSNSRQLACLDNLRQLGVASQLYVAEFQQYPGTLWVNAGFYYVWQERLFTMSAGSRKIFSCPAALSSSAWDLNLNPTLGAVTPQGMFNPWGISSTTRFSYGYNDWGLGVPGSGQLGLGGDINVVGMVKESSVVAPSQMIMIADTTPDGSFDSNIDPKTESEYPSNRHQYLVDILFTDGHTETPLRSVVINPAANAWRSRWNNDNQPHGEFTWSVNPATINRLDPSF